MFPEELANRSARKRAACTEQRDTDGFTPTHLRLFTLFGSCWTRGRELRRDRANTNPRRVFFFLLNCSVAHETGEANGGFRSADPSNHDWELAESAATIRRSWMLFWKGRWARTPSIQTQQTHTAAERLPRISLTSWTSTSLSSDQFGSSSPWWVSTLSINQTADNDRVLAFQFYTHSTPGYIWQSPIY